LLDVTDNVIIAAETYRVEEVRDATRVTCGGGAATEPAQRRNAKGRALRIDSTTRKEHQG
jgi:hypothetical protein